MRLGGDRASASAMITFSKSSPDQVFTRLLQVPEEHFCILPHAYISKLSYIKTTFAVSISAQLQRALLRVELIVSFLHHEGSFLLH